LEYKLTEFANLIAVCGIMENWSDGVRSGYWMLDTGYWIRMLDTGCWMLNMGFRINSLLQYSTTPSLQAQQLELINSKFVNHNS